MTCRRLRFRTEIEKSRKKLTNHSGRKTLVKKLKAAKIPESSIIKVTGHTTVRGLESYDPEDEGEFSEMSHAVAIGDKNPLPISVSSQQTTTVHQQPTYQNQIPKPSNSSNSSLRNSGFPFNPFESFANIFDQFSNGRQEMQITNRHRQQDNAFSHIPGPSGHFPTNQQQPIYNFYNNCTITMSSGQPSTEPTVPKRRRLQVIYDSDDDM